MSFDLYGELPRGTTVLEASAGTGKTWTIAALATRYVAEGVAELSDLMLVTFGRAATQELRERVRERLVLTVRGLGHPSDDALVQHLSRGTPQEVRLRRQRLLRALSQFDGATIATTHSFCEQVLKGLGFAGNADRAVTLVESVDDLLREVVDDLYLRKFAVHTAEPPVISAGEAREAARAAMGDRQARLEPADADPSSGPGQRVGIARAACVELARRKSTAGIRDFDDLLFLLRDVLVDPASGEAACARLRARYCVVLVDEFQDTDPVQWEILRVAFHGHATLVLIGDPKQAIYAFRGAEVLSYLSAVGEADRHETLANNWRTDDGLLRALDHLYGGAALGHEQIVVRPVEAAHRTRRLSEGAPLRLRVHPRAGSGPLGKSGFPAVAALREAVATDVAGDVVRLLRSGTSLRHEGAPRPVRPGDIAVLTRRHVQAAAVHAALDRAGVPSVLSSSTSVYATPSARDWLWLLHALEQPHRTARVRLAALTPLLGWTAQGLDAAGDAAVDEVGALLREASQLFEEAGLAAVFERLSARTRLESRLLAREGGERRLTDLRHLAQSLNRAAVEDSLGLAALVSWLSERVEDPETASLSDRSRRLESDAAAVQVVTVHSSKGLEFPIVYVPYGWDGAKNPSVTTLRVHDADGARVLDIGGKDGPGWAQRKRAADLEDDGEELRLLYVALTRAQCQVVLSWAPAAVTAGAPLHRLLLGRMQGQSVPAARAAVPEDAAALARLTAWGWPDEIAVEPVGPLSPGRWQPEHEGLRSLAAARFDRTIDVAWRRTSYSALTASVHEAPRVGSEPEEPETTDEPAPAPAPTADPALAGPPSPMNDLAGGAAFGTLVHEVLEAVDTGADDLPGELLGRCRAAAARRLSSADPAALAAALLGVLRTPLGFGTLGEVASADRLVEVDFELPLGGGDQPTTSPVLLRDIAGLLRRHLPADDLLLPYADLLQVVEALPLRGYLSGSIDAVLRLPGPAYLVIDYKTNRLGRGDLTALHYSRRAMAAEMLRAHYPLQALLYCVALHRFLRWRQPGYDPAVHLAGVQYLFLRGMVGPATPPGCGVFDWKLPAELVVELSDLLAGS